MRCDHFDQRGRRCLKAWHLAGPHTYRSPAMLGAKRARENVALALFRDEVRARADGLCAARQLVRDNGEYVCGWSRHEGTDPHHLEPNDRDIGRHDPDRALWLCRQAHDFLHAHPDEARTLGLLRPDWLDT